MTKKVVLVVQGIYGKLFEEIQLSLRDKQDLKEVRVVLDIPELHFEPVKKKNRKDRRRKS